jgi:hypothetical protein
VQLVQSSPSSAADTPRRETAAHRETAEHTLHVDNLLFRITPRQLRGVRVFAVVLTFVTVGLAAIAHFRFGLSSPVQGWTIAAGFSCLLALWASFAYAGAFTECSPDGIRVRGRFGLRNHSCPWTEIAKIGLEHWQGSTMINVTRRNASSFRLSAPMISTAMPDPDFDAKFDQILSYWREATPHAGSGLPAADKNNR